MSSSSDKAKGIGNKIAGKAKQVAGDISGDATLHNEGVLQEQKGIAEKAIGDAKAAVKKIIDKA
jgi:uncharacterized protein YjbJ (UPF0337 family)